jgi:hypothetical protein
MRERDHSAPSDEAGQGRKSRRPRAGLGKTPPTWVEHSPGQPVRLDRMRAGSPQAGNVLRTQRSGVSGSADAWLSRRGRPRAP